MKDSAAMNVTAAVGHWYQDRQQGSVFEVVAIDEEAGTIETQLIDGAISEYDDDSWRQLPLREIHEPEDWREAFELSKEDYLDSGDIDQHETWSNPVDTIETDIINGLIDDYN